MSNKLNGRAIETSYSPSYEPSTEDQVALTADPTGAQKTRGQVLTDEGGYVSNFANSSLATSIGTCTFTNGSNVVTTSGDFSTVDLHIGDFVYLTADGSSASQQIDSFTSASIILSSNYTGTGGTGASSRQILKDTVGAGASIAVSNGTCVITSGTTNASVTELERPVDYYPVRKRTVATFSAAPGANSTTYIGLYDESLASPKTFAWFKFTGTSTTQVVCETGWNPTGSVTANETQSSTVYIADVLTKQHQYEVIPTFDGVKFLIDRVQVAFHQNVMPHMGDQLASTVRIVNGTGASSYTVTLAIDACKNYNEVDIATNETQTVLSQISNDRTLPIWAPNSTIPLVIDTQGYNTVRFHIPTAGTASVLTPSWSDDGTNFVTGGGFNPVAGGAYVATITNATAGIWTMQKQARWLRLSAASTQTGGVIVTLSNTIANTINPTITASVSGTVTANLGTGGTSATSIGKAEDAAAASGDTGVFVLGVRRDALTASASATGDYSELATNRFGAQLIADFRTNARSFIASTTWNPASTAGKAFFEFYGNATTTVIVTKITLCCYSTSAEGVWSVKAQKMSTASSGGTKASMTATPLDSTDSAASSTPSSITADATDGTIVGNIGSYIMSYPNSTAIDFPIIPTVLDFGTKAKGLVLSGTSQGVTLAGVASAPANSTITVTVEWHEY